MKLREVNLNRWRTVIGVDVVSSCVRCPKLPAPTSTRMGIEATSGRAVSRTDEPNLTGQFPAVLVRIESVPQGVNNFFDTP